MTHYYCPVEGCKKSKENSGDDQPPFASTEALRGHMNAMTDDNHRQAREEGAWKQAPTTPESGDDEGANDQPETGDDPEATSDEQADDQPDEGGEEPLDPEDEMVSPEEYQRQQGKNEGREADDEQPDTSDEGATEGDSSPSKGPLPNLPPMWTFAIIAGIFAALVLWRVLRSRRADRKALEQAVEEEPDEQHRQPTETPLLE